LPNGAADVKAPHEVRQAAAGNLDIALAELREIT
jgi:hypothetical protein